VQLLTYMSGLPGGLDRDWLTAHNADVLRRVGF